MQNRSQMSLVIRNKIPTITTICRLHRHPGRACFTLKIVLIEEGVAS